MKTIAMTDPLYNYVLSHSHIVHPVLEDLRTFTAKQVGAIMQITPDQGSLLTFLAKLIQARHALEIGCFTGYSAICIASGLTADGLLITVDRDAAMMTEAKRYFAKAGVSERIDARVADAPTAVRQLESEVQNGQRPLFDLCFIDADKIGMMEYYERCLSMTRPGGLVIADNVLWSGAVVNDEDQTDATIAIRRFNDAVARDDRVDSVLLPIADGLFVCRKKTA